MRLLELVRGADTRADVMERLSRYNDDILGKGVVPCNDTVGLGNLTSIGLSESG